MANYQVSATALIKAPAAQVYGIIADYRGGHPQILPKKYFFDLLVDEGGIGAGTVIRFKMRIYGRVMSFNGVVSEPEPGRVLVERYLNDGSISTFSLVPTPDGQQVQVTITTELSIRTGLAGGVERWLTTRFLRRVYREELALLAEVAGQHS